jgi:hypothetical protein
MTQQNRAAMAATISPEHRLVLEEAIRKSDELVGSVHGLTRLQVERTRDLAAAVLHALGPDGSEEERREAAGRLEAGMPGRDWTDQRAPRTAQERRHHQAQRLGRAVLLGWLGHPAVAREVAAAAPELRALVEPLGMSDQLMVTEVTARFLDATAFWPDGSEWPNPFLGAPIELIQDALRIQPLYVAALRELAESIVQAGARVDPNDVGVLLVLAQLVLLDVDLTRPATDLVDGLNILPPGWIDRELATIGNPAIGTSRHGATARFMSDLSASARFLSRLYGPPPIPARYAGGERRRKAQREPVQARRRLALASVLVAFPNANAGELRRTWDLDQTWPGGMLRTKMGLQPHDRPPAETTLREDLREIG